MGIDRMGPWQGGVRSKRSRFECRQQRGGGVEWTTVCALLRGVGPGIGGVVRCFAVKNRKQFVAWDLGLGEVGARCRADSGEGKLKQCRNCFINTNSKFDVLR
jgi:hypothetical protein